MESDNLSEKRICRVLGLEQNFHRLFTDFISFNTTMLQKGFVEIFLHIYQLIKIEFRVRTLLMNSVPIKCKQNVESTGDNQRT